MPNNIIASAWFAPSNRPPPARSWRLRLRRGAA